METKQRFFNLLCDLLKKLDPEVFQPLLVHQSKTLHLHIEDFVSFYLQVQADTLILLSDEPTPDCQTELRGKLSDFIFANNPDPSSFRQGNLQLKGDLAFAQTFSDCLKQCDLDWEGFFADKIGDNAAHFCGQFLSKTTSLVKNLFARRAEDFVYYVQDEKALSPYPEEISAFSDAVDQLKCDVERFEVKLKSIL